MYTAVSLPNIESISDTLAGWMLMLSSSKAIPKDPRRMLDVLIPRSWKPDSLVPTVEAEPPSNAVTLPKQGRGFIE